MKIIVLNNIYKRYQEVQYNDQIYALNDILYQEFT